MRELRWKLWNSAFTQNLNRYNEYLRDDFYYRLCSDVIVIPPLRQRIKEDPQAIDELLSSIVSRIIGEPSKDIYLTVKKVINNQLGSHYPWPGKVRELAIAFVGS